MKPIIGRLTWSVIYFLGICYRVWIAVASSIVDALGLPEEGVKSVLREIVALSYRFVNGISAFFVAVFVDRSYWSSHRRAWSDSDTRSTGRNWTHTIQSTLNAVVAREVSVAGGGRKKNGLSDSVSCTVQPGSSKSKLAPPLNTPDLPGEGKINSTQLFHMPYNLAAVSYDRGVLQESIMYLEIFVTRLFDGLRLLLRTLLLLPHKDTGMHHGASKPARHRRSSFHEMKHVSSTRALAPDEQPCMNLHRSKSTGAVDQVPRKQQEQASGDVSAAALIRACGYPAEEHMVTTSDGYRLRMDRVPRHNCKRCVLFLHGVLDTSLSWVCSGVTESQAFAAWDDGCDVWLASCVIRLAAAIRTAGGLSTLSATRRHCHGWAWAIVRTASKRLRVVQIEHLHNVKCRELGAGIMTMPRTALGVRPQQQTRRTARRTYASEDNTINRRSSPAGSRTRGAARQQLNSSPLRDSWRARTTGTSAHHASDSDLAALGGRQPENVSHGTVMGSGLYQAAKAKCPKTGPKAAPQLPPSTAQGAPEGAAVAESGSVPDRQTCSSVNKPPAPTRHDDMVPGVTATTTTLPRVDSFTTPFEAPCEPVHKPCQAIPSAAAVPLDAVPSPQSPGTPPLTEPNSSGTSDTTSMPGEKSSFFKWLPGHVTGVEQEALQLGVERTGPFFHSAVAEIPLEDVVEINISSCRHSDAIPTTSSSIRFAPQCESSTCQTAASPSTWPKRECMANDDAVHCDFSSSAPAVPVTDVGPRIFGSGSSVCQAGSATVQSSAGGSLHSTPRVHEPYTLTAVGHSLGGAALLMYIVQFRRTQRRHRLSRLVLLTPAGFMDRIPSVVRPIALILPASLRLITWMFPAVVSLPFYVPSSMLRSLMFRLTADVSSMPALTKLVRAWAALCTNGDTSEWDQAMRMPHYNKNSMPAVSLLQAKHMLQWFNTGRFAMFDYGSRDLNLAAYGQPIPVDIAAEYWRIDVPVDFAAGKYDGIISPQCVKKHRNHMIAAGVKHVTYREFEFGHLDFTFSAKQDLRHHVISCIQ